MHHYAPLLAQALLKLSHLSYPEMFLAILASGHPLPLPEGVVFFALGVLAHRGVHPIFAVYLVCALACFVYDILLYSLIYFGTAVAASLSKHVDSKGWLNKYVDVSEKQMFFLTFVSHFVPGWRMANPVIAAGLKVKPQRFALYSILPALVYPATYLLAGYFVARI